MTKAELISHLAENAGLTKVQADKALNALVAAVTGELKTSGALTLAGLGSFVLTRRAARPGLNPQTKAPLTIPASNSVRFKPAKALKDAVN